MSPLAQKPVIHGRDHCPGGADPIPCLEALGAAGDFETVVGSIPNLFAYYRLGETASPWADTSGVATPDNLTERYNVTPGAALSIDVAGALPAGQDDGAVEFNYDGMDRTGGRYLRTQSTKDFDAISGDMTFAAWLKVKAAASTRRGLAVGTSNMPPTHYKQGWGLQVMYPGRTVRFTRGQTTAGGPEFYAETPGGVVADEWNLFVGTYDGATIRLYANGLLIDETADSRGSLSGDLTLRVGYSLVDYVAGDDVPGWLYGTVDEIAVWTRSLDPEEVAALYAGGTGTPGPDAVGDGTIFDRHVNAAADLDPTKLQHPGGTTQFLRADGTWAAPPAGDPATQTRAWMPLADSDGLLVLDSPSADLIPTLITL